MVAIQSASSVHSPYHPAKDKSTFDGGYHFVLHHVESAQPTVEDVKMWRSNHFGTPRDERGNLWVGAGAALCDTIDRMAETTPDDGETAT